MGCQLKKNLLNLNFPTKEPRTKSNERIAKSEERTAKSKEQRTKNEEPRIKKKFYRKRTGDTLSRP